MNSDKTNYVTCKRKRMEETSSKEGFFIFFIQDRNSTLV